MGKFDKSKAVNDIKKVAQVSNEQANLITIKYYNDSDLLDYPRNNEDIDNTEDIEVSIKEQGFTDPIEITSFGAEEGKYYIVSGHRRRMAGRKSGLKKFPCILRSFNSDTEVYNYVLHSNAQRDSAKDPLLFAKRYKMHEEYLTEIGFKGSFREEIAKRLGLKTAQADRYNQMNKVILPIWDMVREGTVGMSSVTDSGLYTHDATEQTEILQIMQECINKDNELTRPTLKKIVNAYRDGKRTWNDIDIEVKQQDTAFNSSNTAVSVMHVNADVPTNYDDSSPSPLRNSEVNYDYSHRDDFPSGSDPLKEERLTDDDKEAIEKALQNNEREKAEKEESEKEEKQIGRAYV